MTKETVVNLGDIAQDPVTGFKGTAICITVWQFGCRRITLQPKGLDKDGKVYESDSFDEPSLKIIKRANVTKAVQKKRRATGGPRPTISKQRPF